MVEQLFTTLEDEYFSPSIAAFPANSPLFVHPARPTPSPSEGRENASPVRPREQDPRAPGNGSRQGRKHGGQRVEAHANYQGAIGR